MGRSRSQLFSPQLSMEIFGHWQKGVGKRTSCIAIETPPSFMSFFVECLGSKKFVFGRWRVWLDGSHIRSSLQTSYRKFWGSNVKGGLGEHYNHLIGKCNCTACIPGIYCLLVGYRLPTTYYQKQNNPMITLPNWKETNVSKPRYQPNIMSRYFFFAPWFLIIIWRLLFREI